MEKAYLIWSQFVEKRKEQRRLENLADNFRHNSILTQHIAKWIISGDRKRTYEGSNVMFIAYFKIINQEILLFKFFTFIMRSNL